MASEPESQITTSVSEFIVGSRERSLPPDVVEKAKQHILDTFAAIISGSKLRPGRLGLKYVRHHAAVGRATVVGSELKTSPEMAAFANGMSAHADESDDVIERLHIGCAIVPAAYAMADANDRSGADFLRAVVAGYGVSRAVHNAMYRSLGVARRARIHPQGIGPTFGAAAAASVLADLDPIGVCSVLSYASQQASAVPSYHRDQSHVGKAFATAAKPAFSGVRSTELVLFGFTDVLDVMDESPSVFDAFGETPDPPRLLRELKEQFPILQVDLKQYPVGMPIQAPAQALLELVRRHDLRASNVTSVICRMPAFAAGIVDARHMPSIHLQYILAVILLDGKLTFASSHDEKRHVDDDVRQIMDRVELVRDTTLDERPGLTSRFAEIAVRTTSGDEYSHQVDGALGVASNPMGRDRVEAKAADLMSGHLSTAAVEGVISGLRDLESLATVRSLNEYLS